MRFLLILISVICFSQNKQSFYFDFNQDNFNSEQQVIFSNWLNENSNVEVYKIEGFCDWVGNVAYNDTLSYMRIKTVFEAIEKQLAVSNEIEFNGFGKRFEQNKNQDLNRRVDVYYKLNDAKVEEVLIKASNLDSIITNTQIGETIRLENLYFYNRSGIVVPKSRPTLKELYQVLVDHPKLKIEIQGHICCQPKKDEEDIALVRALSVYKYLVYNGIQKDRLQYKSFGSSKPIYKIPEKNEEERNANRRVELLILDK